MTPKEFKSRFQLKSVIRICKNQPIERETYVVVKVQNNGVWLQPRIPIPQNIWFPFPRKFVADNRGFIIDGQEYQWLTTARILFDAQWDYDHGKYQDCLDKLNIYTWMRLDHPEPKIHAKNHSWQGDHFMGGLLRNAGLELHKHS